MMEERDGDRCMDELLEIFRRIESMLCVILAILAGIFLMSLFK